MCCSGSPDGALEREQIARHSRRGAGQRNASIAELPAAQPRPVQAGEAIEALDRAIAERPEHREAQTTLAFDVTSRVHGADAAHVARDVSRLLFDRKADPRSLNAAALEVLREEIPFRRLSAVRDAGGSNGSVSVLDMLVETGLVKSKGDARRQLQQGAVSLNGRRLGAEEQTISSTEAIADAYFLVRKGSRDIALVELA